MKKLISFVFATVVAFALVFTAFAACEHEFLAMRNMTSHYEECQKCFEIRNAGNHTFENGKCTVCGYDEVIMNPFTDVPNDAWYLSDLLVAVATDLISGKTPTTFAPSDNLTYAEAVKLAACMNEKYTKGEVTLKVGTPWYQTYVDYCIAKNIIRTEYNWSDFATRVGYMYIFACALPEEAYEVINDIDDGMIPDVPMDSPFAPIVYKMYRAGIVTGVDALHNCNPTANITRAEVAVIVARMMDPSKRIRFDMTASHANTEIETEIKVPTEEVTTVVVTPTVPYEPNLGDYVYDDIKETETTVEVKPTVPYEPDLGDYVYDATKAPLSLIGHPESHEAKAYGEKAELKVVADGGKPAFTYEWHYYTGYRNETAKIENSEFVSGADTDTLTVSVEKENTVLGTKIFCKVKDANGVEVTSNKAAVYGPFAMPINDVTVITALKEYTVIGTVADGVVRKGDKVSVESNGKIIAIGTVKDLQMFNKSLDEAIKGDNVGVVIELTDGARPMAGGTLIKYDNSHVIDTSDIIN